MTNNNNLILKPLAGMRGKKHDTLKGCSVEATVDMFDGWTRGSDYHHPTLRLRKVHVSKDGTRSYGDLLEIKFQRHNVTLKPEWRSEPEKPTRGFLAGERGIWSYSYGGQVSGDLAMLTHLSTGLTLIERAQEALRKKDKVYRNLSRIGDDLLSAIVGLRLIGVTVVVKNAKRSMRTAGLSIAA